MTPQQLTEFNDMKKRLIDIESARNVSFIKELQRRLISGSLSVEDGASSSGTTVAVRNATDTGSETVANDYAGVMNVYQNGVLIGKVGYY
jgi:hypothetical protein